MHRGAPLADGGVAMSERRGVACFVGALCLYGTVGWVLSCIDMPSDVVVLCRGAIGCAFVAAVLLASRRGVDWAAVRANVPWLCVGGLSLGLNWVLLFAAYRATTVAVATLCNYMAPIMLILVAPVLLHERRSVPKTACAFVAVFGMVLVSGVLGAGGDGVTAQGIGLGLAAAVFSAALVLANKKLCGIPVLERSVVQLAFATAAALPWAVFSGLGARLNPDAASVALVVLLGVVHTGVAYCLYFAGLARIGAQTAAVLGYVEPVVSVLVSTTVMHEPLSAMGWAGAAGIVVAAAASELLE